MRPPTPHPRPHAGRPRARACARAGLTALALATVLGGAAGPLACASAPGAPARRNRMEAPPPFPTAPDFTLPDAAGAPRSLGSLMGSKGLVLVLYRGHW